MSDTKATSRKYSKKQIVAVLLLLGLGWFLFQLFAMKTDIVVSKETTFITEPLGSDGLPDFPAYILARDSEGVTPENNAAVLIWQATWPGNINEQYWAKMADALGMKEVPTGEDSLVGVYSHEVRNSVFAELLEAYSSELTDEQADELLTEEWQQRLQNEFADEAIDEAMLHPWASEQLPALAAWAEANRKPLDLLIEAAARPKYFAPYPNLLDGADILSMINILLPQVQEMRNTVRALLTRGMWNLGNGRADEAWVDILACFRLAQHTGRGNFLVEQLVAIAIDGVACRATVTILQHEDLKADLAAQILADLQALPSVSGVAYSLDQGERLMFIDIVIRWSQGQDSMQSLTGTGSSVFEMVSHLAFDWNFILREGNAWYDRLVKAGRLPTRAERKRAFANFDAELAKLSATATGPGAVLGSMVSRRRRSRMMSDVLLSLCLPALNAATRAEDRAITKQQLTVVAAALAVYRTRQGEYPENLAELVPSILPKMPLDLYTEQPFIYERQNDGGYLLYSLFENGVDDGGTNYGGEIIGGEWVDQEDEELDYNSTDLVIRVPEPAFKLPRFPIEELTP